MNMADLRFGVIGWGYWGPKVARNLASLPHAVVAMVADTDVTRLASSTANFSPVRTTTQAEDVFRSDVDGVVIATPVRTHYRLAKEALLHGKHVLVEKPLTANVAEAEELVTLAIKQQRTLMAGHTFEYSPAASESPFLLAMGLKEAFLVGGEADVTARFRFSPSHQEWFCMKKAYRYRLYPTKKQETILNQQLALCCELYNAALQERRDAYRMGSKSISFTQQSAQLPEIKAVRPEYETLYSQVLQDALHRVDKAFKAFFRRCRAGQTPGHPRYKSPQRYDSLTYPQAGFGIDEQGKLSLSKIGHIKMVQHRPLKGVVKTCTITRSATGKWFVCFSCDEVAPAVLPASSEAVGIDVGLTTFAYLSDGCQIDNPRFFRQEEEALARAQRRLAKEAQGTPVRRKRRKIVARVHERVRCRRENFVQQESRRLVNRYGLIAVEALVVRNMVKRPKAKQDQATGVHLPNGAAAKAGLNKSIADAAWSLFFEALVAKAEEAERQVIKVPPAYTTQTCADSGYRQAMPLPVRRHACERCGGMRERDHNASLNILATALGRQDVALGT